VGRCGGVDQWLAFDGAQRPRTAAKEPMVKYGEGLEFGVELAFLGTAILYPPPPSQQEIEAQTP
jgi:hypothetical protein